MILRNEIILKRVGQYSKVVNRPLSGKPIVIIGGGPGFQPSMMRHLAPFDCILTNNAFTLAYHPSVVVAFDARYYLWHGREILSRGHLPICALREGQPAPMNGKVHVMRKETANDRSTQPPEHGVYTERRDTLPGRNSGHGAVHLALHLGAARVYLAGFDMSFRDGRSHWHEGHRIPASQSNYENRFRPDLEALVGFAKAAGVDIAAITPTEAAIPAVPFEDALDDLHENHPTAA